MEYANNEPENPVETLAIVPLERFLSQLPDSLSIVNDAPPESPVAAGVRWVEPSELGDPTPFLLEGEFVLTAGLPFLGQDGSAEAIDAYVRRLVAAQVCALGFGVSPYFSDIPEQLAAACRRHRLTLVRIPEEVPFAAVGLEFARLLEAENLSVLREVSEANRQLMRAVVAARPEAEIIEALIQYVPVWAVLAGADGRLRARSAPARLRSSMPSMEEMAQLLARLFGGSGPRIEMEDFGTPGAESAVGYPLRSTRDANLGALVVGSAEPLRPVEKSIVETAVSLLEALARQRTTGALAPGQLATSLLLHPETMNADAADSGAVASRLLTQSASAPRNTRLRVVQGMPSIREQPAGEQPAAVAVESARRRPQGPGPVRELLQWRRVFDTRLVETTDYGFAAITRLTVDDSVVAEVEKLGWRIVISDTAELHGLPGAYRQATALRQQAQLTGKSLRADAVQYSVTGLLGQEAGRMLARRCFEPLQELETERAAALLKVLHGWLEENGSWDRSAKLLGMHRNSVRRQINHVGELLGRDLADAQTRAELLIALNYLETEMLPPA